MKNTRVGKILFLYTSGRKERIEKVNDGQAPTDFLYGYTYFKEAGIDVDYVETDYFYPKWFDMRYWRLKKGNQNFADHLTIGNRSHLFLNQIEDLNNYDILIATTDSIALGLAYHKKSGQLRTEIIYLNMGLAASLYKLKHNCDDKYLQYAKEIEALLGFCKKIISLGQGEYEFFIDEFPQLNDQFVFIPFGVDTDFWKSSNNSMSDRSAFVLFIGNDKNRDYEMLINIAEKCPDRKFKFVTSMVNQVECPPNVELMVGNWRKSILSDKDLRKLISSSSLVILPLKESLQPSGQSVALQAMACKTPIIITKTDGIWDIDVMKHLKNCFFVAPGDLNGFLEGIDFILDTPGEGNRLGYSGRQTIERYYRCQQFAEKLHSYI